MKSVPFGYQMSVEDPSFGIDFGMNVHFICQASYACKMTRDARRKKTPPWRTWNTSEISATCLVIFVIRERSQRPSRSDNPLAQTPDSTSQNATRLYDTVALVTTETSLRDHDERDGVGRYLHESFGSWFAWAECTGEEIRELDRPTD